MKETIEKFGGKDLHLRGTLCYAEEPNKSNNPCIIMLNSGLVYQAGPNRLYAELAHETAKQGFYSFRFDLSGIGDSNRSREHRVFEEQILIDISDALTHIENKTGISSFILMGICTGADNAHKYALQNSKVTGAIFLDGYAYKTLGYYIRHYAPKIINPKTIIRRLFRFFSSIKQVVTKLVSPLKQQHEKEKVGYFWDVPPKEKTLKELQLLVNRNILQLHIFTSDWGWCFNHRSQFDNMYKTIDFKGFATCIYFDKSDHTYTLVDDRLLLIETIINWLGSSYQTSS